MLAFSGCGNGGAEGAIGDLATHGPFEFSSVEPVGFPEAEAGIVDTVGGCAGYLAAAATNNTKEDAACNAPAGANEDAAAAVNNNVWDNILGEMSVEDILKVGLFSQMIVLLSSRKKKNCRTFLYQIFSYFRYWIHLHPAMEVLARPADMDVAANKSLWRRGRAESTTSAEAVARRSWVIISATSDPS